MSMPRVSGLAIRVVRSWFDGGVIIPDTDFFNCICLFLAVLGLPCHTQASSSYEEWQLLFVTMHGSLLAVATLVWEHGL